MQMLTAALVSVVLAAAPAADRVVVKPVQIEGALDDAARQQLQTALLDGLRRAEFVLEDEQSEGGYLVRTTISVDERLYRVTVVLVDIEGRVVVSTSGVCDICGRNDVADLVASQGAKARRQLDLLKDEPPPRPPPPKIEPEDPTEPEPKQVDTVARVDQRKVWGGVTLGTGLGGVVAGTVLLVLHNRPYRSRCAGNDVDFSGECRFVYNTVAGGATALSVGVGLVATGIALLVLSKRRPRKLARRSRSHAWLR